MAILRGVNIHDLLLVERVQARGLSAGVDGPDPYFSGN